MAIIGRDSNCFVRELNPAPCYVAYASFGAKYLPTVYITVALFQTHYIVFCLTVSVNTSNPVIYIPVLLRLHPEIISEPKGKLMLVNQDNESDLESVGGLLFSPR